MSSTFQFDPVDIELMRVRSRLSAGQRIQAMLDARELIVGLKQGCLRKQYPNLTPVEINLKLLEELERVYDSIPRFDAVSSHT